MDEESEVGPKWGRQQPVFLPKLLGKKVMVKLVDGKQVSGTIKGFNAYEIRLGLPNNAEWLIFKHGILAIEYPEGYMNKKE